jgi:hypothetical protein
VREDIAKLQSNRIVGVISADSQKSDLEGVNKEVKYIGVVYGSISLFLR